MSEVAEAGVPELGAANPTDRRQLGPTEPPLTSWQFPPADTADEAGVVGAGADLAPGTLIAGYKAGIFPMPLGNSIGWWSPDPRGILPLSYLRVSSSLRKSCRRYEIRINHDFETVLDRCADPARPNGWISDDIRTAYLQLHELGWAHSVEAWLDGQLAGGLYGVGIGAFFAGESMFHDHSDASKVALVALVDALKVTGGALIDVQWNTPHLRSLGAIDVPRSTYLKLLSKAIAQPHATLWYEPVVFKIIEPEDESGLTPSQSELPVAADQSPA